MAVSGKVVHYDANRGFGFLAPDEGGADVFLHINDIDIDENDLKPGAKVEFDVEDTDRGSKATNLVVVEAAPADDHAGARAERRERHDRHDRGGHERHDRGGHDRGGRGRGPRGGSGSLDAAEFTEELTELLLDSSDSLTAAQIIAIRRRVTDFAVGRGWVLD